jgi:hypothetical protein
MPKRPPGVYKRGSSWSVVIDHRDPATGARRKVWHSGLATMGEAAEARIRLLRERDTGSTVPASHMTLGQYLMDVWLPERKPAPGESARGHRGRLGVQSWQMYHEAMRRYVVPTLGGVRLQKLAARDLDQLYDALERTGGRKGTGLSSKTVANVHGVLHKARCGTPFGPGWWCATWPTSSVRRSRPAPNPAGGPPNSSGRSCATSRAIACTRCGCCSPPRACVAARFSASHGTTSTSSMRASACAGRWGW